MSEKMLTGNQLKDSVYRSAVPVLWQDNIEIVEGLGLLNSAIVDQHFIVRSRHNRLLSAVLENRMDGIGIDESTAIIIQGDSAAVVGESQVIVYRKPERTTRAGKNLIGAEQIGLSVYLPGDKFKIIH
jgi:cyanophycinase